jgi:hypothetical protein
MNLEYNKKININKTEFENVVSNKFNISLEKIISCGDAVIFGGATRDFIRNGNIDGDLDIIAGSETCKNIIEYINENNYVYIKDDFWIDYYTFEFMSNCINYQHKESKNKIQIINPKHEGPNTKKVYIKNNINNIIHSVDMTCSGIIYNYNGFFEVIEGSYNDCKLNQIKIIKDANYYNEYRIQGRIDKLLKRGWELHKDPSIVFQTSDFL